MVSCRVRLCGMLGNLVTAIINVLFVAEKLGNNLYFEEIQFPPGFNEQLLNGLIGKTFIPGEGIVDKGYPGDDTLIISMNIAFYCPQFIPSEKEKIVIARNYIYSFLPPPQVIKSNQLVIHVRSGDIFEGVVHPNMMQPPLQYYRHILTHENFTNVILVAQNLSNPVISPLLKEFPYIRLQCSSVEEDTRTVLSATHLVIGVGTFGHMLSLLSPSLESLYCFTNHNVYYHESKEYGYDIHVLTADGYPEHWNGDYQVLLNDYVVHEKSMESFVEMPRAVWDFPM